MTNYDRIKELDYLKGFSDSELSLFAEKITEKRFSQGNLIILEGEKSEFLNIVYSGRVKIFKTSEEGREHIFYFAKKGDDFGEISAFDGLPSPFSAVAVIPTLLLTIRVEDLKELMRKIPGLPEHLLTNLSLKMRQMMEMVEDLSFKNVPERLAKILVEMAENEGVRSGKNVALQRNITLFELASLVGTVREVITRSLQKLEKEGLIVLGRRKIEIIDLEKLRRY